MEKESLSLGQQLIRGGFALSMAKLATRALGVISALTVPRWLGPEEMGLFAVAMLAIAALHAFTESGFSSAFMQRKVDFEQYIEPVRTFNLLRGFAMGGIIFLSAPYVANFMNAPRSENVLKALAISPVLTGAIPMIWTLASKRLRFAYLAKYNVGMTVLNLVITVPLAWYLKNVWALVWGLLIASSIDVVISSFLSREGRGFTTNLSPLKDLRAFGFWIFLTCIISYFYINGGNWIIGRLLDVQSLAVYTLAFKFSTMFTGEAASIISQMTLPVFSHLQDDLPRLREGFRKSFGILAMITVGVGVFFCVAARDYFVIVLEDKWSDYTTLFNHLLPWLALWGICSALAGAQTGVFQALGKPKWWMWTVVVMCLLMVILLWPAVHFFGAVGVAGLLGGIAATMQIVRYILLGRMLQLRFSEVSAHVVVPAFAGILAVTVSTSIRGHFTANIWGQAFLANGVVVLFYIAALLAFSRYIYPNPAYLIGNLKGAIIGKLRESFG